MLQTLVGALLGVVWLGSGGNDGDNGLTARQLYLLKRLYDISRRVVVYTVEKPQEELAEEIGVTRQALSSQLKVLRSKGKVRTGRGFLDITADGLKALGRVGGETMVFVRVSPAKRKQVYDRIVEKGVGQVFRVAGDVSVIMVVDHENLDTTLQWVSGVEGVLEVEAHLILESSTV